VDCCFECEGCQVSNLFCELGTQKIQGFNADGYFQEYVAVKYRNAVILPEGMDPAKVAPLCCAGVTSFNAVSAVELQLGDWLAIIGCGGLGHLG
jgi:propanol-preferring alcohol dehydrogenase